jgi:uncharacterized protein (DUF58 family)
MIPTRWLLLAVALLLPVGLLPALQPQLIPAWWGLLGLIVLVSLLDAFLAWRQPLPQITRRLPGSLALGVPETITLRLRHKGKRPQTITVFDHYPTTLQVEGLPSTVSLATEGYADIRYLARPLERGEAWFRGVQLRLLSPLRLWWQQSHVELENQVRVYPNFAAVAKYTLLAADNRLSQMGIRKHRRRGEGQDFHQLREYRQGDPLRQIDWKASARLRKLISREYQEERDQEIIFLLDCGHRMLARDDELSHFDHSLNAILLLAYVALRQGDGVGFGNFSGEQRWLKPIKGISMINHLFNTLYDLQPSTHVPDYAAAATQLLLRQKKRALVVLITNLRDEDNADLLPAIRLLQQRHLVLVASMQEQALSQVLDNRITDFDQALRHAATRDYLQSRGQAVDALRARGIMCLDVIPRDLSVALVNQYLDIKASARL